MKRLRGILEEEMLAPIENTDKECLIVKDSAISYKWSSILDNASPELLMNGPTAYRSIWRFLERIPRAAVWPAKLGGVGAVTGVRDTSIQMDLNSFHLADSSSGHVTLGISGLRKLLTTKYPKPTVMKFSVSLKREITCGRSLSRLAKSCSLGSAYQNGRGLSSQMWQRWNWLSRRGIHRYIQITLIFLVESLNELQLGFRIDALCQFSRNNLPQKVSAKIRADIKKSLRTSECLEDQCSASTLEILQKSMKKAISPQIVLGIQTKLPLLSQTGWVGKN